MSTDITTTDTSGRHPINVANLVMGTAFLGLVGIWAAISGDLIDGGDIRWLLPVPWVLAGLAGLLAITFGGRRRATAAEQPAYEPYAAPYSTPPTSPPARSTDEEQDR